MTTRTFTNFSNLPITRFIMFDVTSPDEIAAPSGNRRTLELGGEKTIHAPSEADIVGAVEWMDSMKNDAFVILSSTGLTYMQAAGDEKNGFTVEYQDGSLAEHFVADRTFSAMEVQSALISYAKETSDWRGMAVWKHLPL